MNIHNDQPSKETPVTGRVTFLFFQVMITGILGPPVQLEHIRVVIGLSETLELKTVRPVFFLVRWLFFIVSAFCASPLGLFLLTIRLIGRLQTF